MKTFTSVPTVQVVVKSRIKDSKIRRSHLLRGHKVIVVPTRRVFSEERTKTVATPPPPSKRYPLSLWRADITRTHSHVSGDFHFVIAAARALSNLHSQIALRSRLDPADHSSSATLWSLNRIFITSVGGGVATWRRRRRSDWNVVRTKCSY